MEWVKIILKEYIIKNNILTNSERLEKAYLYINNQGYSESIGILCDALIADRKIIEILEGQKHDIF
jgi:hypothetical protein